MQHENSNQLMEFVDAAKSKGASDEFLISFLAHQGWPEDELFAALGAYWQRVTGLTAPKRTGRGESSREAFLYLLSFATLATWAGALGSLLFRFVDYWFPDPVSSPFYNLRAAVTWQMASLAVAFPIFLLVMRTILAEAHSHPDHLQSGIRKWLTYIALLLTAGGIISDLICFLDFLTGELTTRFLLKAFTVLAICAAIFFYYLRSLRWDKDIGRGAVRRISLNFGWGSLVVVAVCFITGMVVTGTPSIQRHLEADKKRVQDLRSIALAVHLWHTQAVSAASPRLLPAGLNALLGKGVNPSQTADPETRRSYEYRTLSPDRYQLCASFSAPTEENATAGAEVWSHGGGRTCFMLSALAPSGQ